MPLVWKSQLQTTVSLSTMEAEYTALSTSMRVLIPIREMLLEFIRHVQIPSRFDTVNSSIQTTVHEDNSGALEMARSPKMRPRTKHINRKYHWFRSLIAKAGENIDGKVVVLAIDTKDQLADIFTKAVTQELFLKFRKAIFGW